MIHGKLTRTITLGNIWIIIYQSVIINKLCYFDWQFADDARALIRREKALPSLVDLLGQDRDDIVCHSALALRNLAIDENNKALIGIWTGTMQSIYVCIETIKNILGMIKYHTSIFFCPGKYALKPIINTLPLEKQKENVPDRTICAAVALLQEVLKNSIDFAQYVMVLSHLFGFITCSTIFTCTCPTMIIYLIIN